MTGSLDKTAIIWDPIGADKIQILAGHTGAVRSVALDTAARKAVTGSTDNHAILWNMSTGEPLHVLAGHTDTVSSVGISGDGKRVVTGSYDKTAILWDAETGEKVRTFAGHRGRIYGVALSGDGRRVVTASWDGTTRIWDTESGDELVSLISLDAGKEWLVVALDGYFDSSDGGERLIDFRVAGDVDLVSLKRLDRLREELKRPGLLAEVWAGRQ
jgi:WD40 repeat protein